MHEIETVGIPVWSGEVSNVFDFAARLLIVRVQGGQIIERRQIDIASQPCATRAEMLSNLGVSVLICGGISRCMAAMCGMAGINLVPDIAGDVEEVLKAWLQGRIAERHFVMPGCRRFEKGRHGRRCRAGHGRTDENFKGPHS